MIWHFFHTHSNFSGAKYTNCTKSWYEQRQFLDFTLASLGNTPVAKQVKQELINLIPDSSPDVPSAFFSTWTLFMLISRSYLLNDTFSVFFASGDYERVTDITKTFSCRGAKIGFGQNGAITTLSVAGVNLNFLFSAS